MSRRPAQIIVPVASVAAMLLLGLFLGRVVRGEAPAPNNETAIDASAFAADEVGRLLLAENFDIGDRAQLTAADVLPVPERTIPVAAPVLVSHDPSGGDVLLDVDSGEPPPLSAGSGLPVPRYAGASGAYAPDDQVVLVLETPAGDGSPVDTTSGSGDTIPETSTGTAAETTSDIPDASPDAPPDETVADGSDDEGILGTPPVRPYVYQPNFGILLDLPPITFDSCAGPAPGDPIPEGCPDGVGAVLLGLDAPPGPLAYFALGHYLESTTPEGNPCPADTPPPGAGQRAGTLFSHVPLAGVRAEYRPYGSDLAWTEVTIEPTGATETEQWLARLETTEWSHDWGILASCFVVDADPETSYEIRAFGVDAFDRVVEAYLGHLRADNAVLRPPTTATAPGGLTSTATVSAWTHSGGHVTFRTRTITDADAELDCSIAGPVSGDAVTTGVATRPGPDGLYDPAYARSYGARIAVPAGARLLVCADIFLTENPLRPFVTDRVLVEAATQQQPRIVLQGIRRIGEDPIAAGLRVVSGAEASGYYVDYCASGFNFPELPPGRAHDVEQTLWECSRAGSSPLDRGGAYDVPVRIWRMNGDERETIAEVAIPIQVNDCRTESCDRPREWFEIPIPAASRRLCGDGAGACDDLSHLDGIAVLRVEYPVVEGPAGLTGSATLLDQIDPAMLGAQPRLTRPEATFRDTDDVFLNDMEVTFFSDRPLRIALTTYELDGEPCFAGEPLPMTEEFSDTFSFVVTDVCTSYSYINSVHAIDESGTEYDIEIFTGHTAPARSAFMTSEVELLGGPDLAELGFLYQFGLTLDRQTAAAHWDTIAPAAGRNLRCVALDGTSVVGRGRAPEIFLIGTTLDVRLRLDITTTGDGDCSGLGSTGLGELVFEGSFTRAELLSDEPLVLTSGSDQPLQVRVTITRTDRWR